MDNTLSGLVDVLAEMQADIDALEQRVLAGEFTLSRGYDKVNRLRSIHAAVAELIEASRALLAYRQGTYPVGGWLRDNGASRAQLDALATALENIGSTK